MDAQRDYETEPTVAVFDSPDDARRAVSELRARRFDIAAIGEEPLAPGRYQAEDPSLWEVTAGMIRGALLGAPVGVLFGIGQAALLPSEPTRLVLAGGVLGGALLGAYFGAIQRTRFDDDQAEWVDVPDGARRELVAVYTSGPAPRIRQLLRRTGARAFLDPTIPATERALRLAHPA